MTDRNKFIQQYLREHPDAPVGECDKATAAEFGCSEPAARAARLRLQKSKPVGEQEPKHSRVLEVGDHLHFASKRGILKLHKDVVAAMKRRYSNWDGDPSTYNDICREFGISRKDFHAIKTGLGWSHDSSPFLDDELVGEDYETMLSDLARMAEGRLEGLWRKRKATELQKKADAYDRAMRLGFEPLSVKVAQNPPRSPVSVPELDPEAEPALVIPMLTDVHLGAMLYRVDAPSIRERVLESQLDLAGRCPQGAKVLLPVGSDFLHFDNGLAKTASGRIQLQINAEPERLLWDATDLMIEVVDIWRSVGSQVDLRLVAGNHDRLLGASILQSLKLGYQNCADVQAHMDFDPRAYHADEAVGWLAGLSHGDGASAKKLPGLMPLDVPELWAKCKNRLYLTGHLHHEMWAIENGVRLYQCPALAGTDRYHIERGFNTSRPGSSAFILRPGGMRVETYLCP